MTCLNDSVEVVAHGHLGHVAHEVVEPVIQPGQHIDRFHHVPANQDEKFVMKSLFERAEHNAD